MEAARFISTTTQYTRGDYRHSWSWNLESHRITQALIIWGVATNRAKSNGHLPLKLRALTSSGGRIIFQWVVPSVIFSGRSLFQFRPPAFIHEWKQDKIIFHSIQTVDFKCSSKTLRKDSPAFELFLRMELSWLERLLFCYHFAEWLRALWADDW